MMRQPTPQSRLYAWHAAAIAGGEGRVYENEVECGWFKTRWCRKGPLILPARIWMQQPIDPETGELNNPEELCCEVDGERRDPDEQWTFLCRNPIPKNEYDYLAALRRWQRVNAPDEFAAGRRPVDTDYHLSTPIME